jgi:hypothetical protein
MSKEILQEFVKDALSAGSSKQEAREVLIKAGWRQDQVDIAVNQYSDLSFKVPVPSPINQTAPRIFYYNICFFVLFYITTYNFTSALFSIIDSMLPDAAGSYYGYFYRSSIADSLMDNVSILIISIPLLLYFNSLQAREMQKSKQMCIPRVRLMLIFLSLFIGFTTVLITFSSMIYFFLDGSLALRFVIKLAILILTMVLVRSYFRPEISKAESQS